MMDITPSPRQVLIVEDDRSVRLAATQTLDLAGFSVEAVESAEAALRQVDCEWPGVVVSDVRLVQMGGIELHRRLAELDPDLPVILMTGHGDIAMAVAAMRDGVYDFLEKPYAADRLVDSVRRASEKRALVMENRRLRMALTGSQETGLVGRSKGMQRLRQQIATAAETDANVLILGETGSGKEVVVRALHRLSSRRDQPFVALNCGALPENIFESELFGHERGAFTGADKRRIGRIEHANGGTLYLDEIESMPLVLQVKILRVLQERVIEPLGTNKMIPIDIRIVAGTKVDLAEESRAGRFRADLYYRLNVIDLKIPPLRERREDISLLFTHFAELAALRYRRPIPPLTAALLSELATREWPGNVRELQNEAERFVLGVGGASPVENNLTLPEQVDRFECGLIEAALAEHPADLNAVLAQLGLPRKTFYDKLKRYGLSRRDFQ